MLSVIIAIILTCYISQNWPHFLVNFFIMNSHQILDHRHFQVLIFIDSYYFTLILLQKMRFTERTLQSTPNHWHCCQISRCWTLHAYFTTEEGSTWHLVLCKHETQNQKLGREIADIKVDCFLPGYQIHSSFPLWSSFS